MVMEIINNTMSATNTVRDILLRANFIKAPKIGSLIVIRGDQYVVVSKRYVSKRMGTKRVKRTKVFVSLTGV